MLWFQVWFYELLPAHEILVITRKQNEKQKIADWLLASFECLILAAFSAISQMLSHALYAGSITCTQAVNMSFQFTCHWKFSSAPYLKHLYLLSAPWVSHISMVIVKYWNIKYGQQKLTLKKQNNVTATNDLSNDCFHFSFYIFSQWFCPNQLLERHIIRDPYCQTVSVMILFLFFFFW